MALNQEQVEHVARLARLSLTEEEKVAFTRQLSSVLDYVSQLSEVDVSGVAPLAHVGTDINVLRSDEVDACAADVRERLLAAFPEREGDLLKVKAVL